MGKEITEQSGPMKVIFNYNDVFFSFYYDDVSGCVHRSREYAMNYVYSGEMILDNGKEEIHVGKGECVFIPHSLYVGITSFSNIRSIIEYSLCMAVSGVVHSTLSVLFHTSPYRF